MTERTYTQSEVDALVASAAQQGEVNGAEAMREIAAQVAEAGAQMETGKSLAEYIRSMSIPITPISDYLTAQLAEARAAQRESDAKIAASHKRGEFWHGSCADCPEAIEKEIRANVTPADARYIERVRAEAALECKESLTEAANALDSLWAAIGDALCSGKGIEKEYANGVARDVAHAKERIERELSKANRA